MRQNGSCAVGGRMLKQKRIGFKMRRKSLKQLKREGPERRKIIYTTLKILHQMTPREREAFFKGDLIIDVPKYLGG